MLTARTSLAATTALALLLSACGGGHDAPIDAPIDAPSTSIDAGVDAPSPSDGGVDADPAGYVPQPPVDLPPPPPVPDLSAYPRDEQGRPILLEGSQYYLTERAPDALTALSDCTAMIVRCVDPAIDGHNLDACVTSTPRCTTDQPWLEATPCCATACVDRYVARRTDRTPPITAFREAFYRQPSCAPGVDALLGGAP